MKIGQDDMSGTRECELKLCGDKEIKIGGGNENLAFV